MRAFAFTGAGRVRRFAGGLWPPPGVWADAGRGSRVEHLPVWIAAELWVVELNGGVHDVETQLRADRGRLVRRVDAWDEAAASGFARASRMARWSATSVLPVPAEPATRAGPAKLLSTRLRCAAEACNPRILAVTTSSRPRSTSFSASARHRPPSTDAASRLVHTMGASRRKA